MYKFKNLIKIVNQFSIKNNSEFDFSSKLKLIKLDVKIYSAIVKYFLYRNV